MTAVDVTFGGKFWGEIATPGMSIFGEDSTKRDVRSGPSVSTAHLARSRPLQKPTLLWCYIEPITNKSPIDWRSTWINNPITFE